MSRLHYLQHADKEGLGFIEEWAEARGHEVTCTHVYRGEALPALNAFDALVLMGGAMSANDEVPWMKKELEFVQASVDADKHVLGICLGAQLLARALGATVTTMPHPEIGWHTLQQSAAGRDDALLVGIPESFVSFQWHFDTFSLPAGSTVLASSGACPHQIVRLGPRALALQCHLEETHDSIEYLLNNFAHEIIPGPHTQSSEEIRASVDDVFQINQTLSILLDRWMSS